MKFRIFYPFRSPRDPYKGSYPHTPGQVMTREDSNALGNDVKRTEWSTSLELWWCGYNALEL